VATAAGLTASRVRIRMVRGALTGRILYSASTSSGRRLQEAGGDEPIVVTLDMSFVDTAAAAAATTSIAQTDVAFSQQVLSTLAQSEPSTFAQATVTGFTLGGVPSVPPVESTATVNAPVASNADAPNVMAAATAGVLVPLGVIGLGFVGYYLWKRQQRRPGSVSGSDNGSSGELRDSSGEDVVASHKAGAAVAPTPAALSPGDVAIAIAAPVAVQPAAAVPDKASFAPVALGAAAGEGAQFVPRSPSPAPSAPVPPGSGATGDATLASSSGGTGSGVESDEPTPVAVAVATAPTDGGEGAGPATITAATTTDTVSAPTGSTDGGDGGGAALGDDAGPLVAADEAAGEQ
jgi:hypothetical protein